MILKIENVETDNNADAWRFIDGVSEISVASVKIGDVFTHFNRVFLRKAKLNEEGTALVEADSYVKIIYAWIRYGESCLTIITDTPAYIMSDEGKTIERIN